MSTPDSKGDENAGSIRPLMVDYFLMKKKTMRIAILAPIAWRTPPRKYGPWEQVASTLTEGLIKRGFDVTLFATANSLTGAHLRYSTPRGYAEDLGLDPKVEECLHISQVMESAHEFDIIHNHFDFLPLSFSRLIPTPMVTTIHGFSSPKIIPVYRKYNDTCSYVSISNADRSPELTYLATVYNGIDTSQFEYVGHPSDYLLYFGRIHPEKGAHLAIEAAKRSSRRLILAGLVQDERYFETAVAPYLDGSQIQYVGNVGPADRNQLLGNATALLHLISFEEPFGLSVAEAMLCGTPVIAFNRGSMSELIVPGKTGFLSAHIDEVIPLLDNLPAISRKHCTQWAKERFSQDAMVDQYIQVYKQVLAH
ncbi:glycosyltransferase family 4 protein [Parapedobacter indicus]|uniref:Glycosyltransferase involved in cell wall bisynthesis n=1 Tax=Parapedobacter indicus TaxID=1477437 RepID=A0A1I3RKM5_9SPHI|nr:glycosyltransferase family 4 protein [Parapedobacter indicus]PPL00070.1 glycosyltransferase involved in cell wall biosynthesis [Parapedobacter indicus]SFJ47154.1 Glycosyltransferase involved in cell wall bisynthesis [Parapedobacter indicus]